ncbi:MAG: MotA/TolQ/ExbB proton channel family protein [Kiritimatiellae bacterium]|nr:MotA/TolQ/ExbB proton channel family protein [Kiritimatiellia bacterium]
MLELFIKGGWVMYGILSLSILGLALIIERLVFFLRNRHDDVSLFKKAEDKLKQEGYTAALRMCAEERGIICGMVTACLKEWPAGCERMEDIVNFEGNRAVELFEKHLRGLSVIAQSAPLLGLLGTVTGMIRAFMRIAELGGQVNVSALACGIWEALLTTAFGLIVAIPALFAYHFFEARVERYARLMRDVGERLVVLRRMSSGT